MKSIISFAVALIAGSSQASTAEWGFERPTYERPDIWRPNKSHSKASASDFDFGIGGNGFDRANAIDGFFGGAGNGGFNGFDDRGRNNLLRND